MSREFPHTVEVYEITQAEDDSRGYDESRGTKRYDGAADVQDARASLGEALAAIEGDSGLESRANMDVFLPDGKSVADLGIVPGDEVDWTDTGQTGRVRGVNHTEEKLSVAFD